MGFHDPFTGRIAALLEFGNAATNLPERPAFRQALERIKFSKPDLWAQARADKAVTRAAIEAAARGARDIIRQAYLDFHGTPLSERSRERKAGTPHELDQLVGAEGPKLIQHIHAYVDGREV